MHLSDVSFMYEDTHGWTHSDSLHIPTGGSNAASKKAYQNN